MTEALQLLTFVAIATVLAAWGLYQGRKERDAERRAADDRQQSLYFGSEKPRDKDQHRGAAMSRLS